MNVVYVCDDRFAWIAGISMLSLLKHNSGVHIYLLGWMLSDDSKEKLSLTVSRENGKLEIIDIPERYIHAEFETFRWPAVAFVRLHMAEFLSQDVKKALYLDCDTIILDNLEPLWNLDMEGNIFCGVKDCLNWRDKRNIGLSKTAHYINSGVMLADIEQLRAYPFVDHEKLWMNTFSANLSYPDQDMLNGVFQGKLGILDARYNVMTIVANWDYQKLCLLRRPTCYYTKDEISNARKKPAIVHYTTNLWTIRPWFCDSDHPWAGEFDKYMLLSPWSDKKKEKVSQKAMSWKALKIMKRLPIQVSLGLIGYIHTFIHPSWVRIKMKYS